MIKRQVSFLTYSLFQIDDDYWIRKTYPYDHPINLFNLILSCIVSKRGEEKRREEKIARREEKRRLREDCEKRREEKRRNNL